MHSDVILTICAQTYARENACISSRLCQGVQPQKFPVCQWQWCHMASCVDCICVVCCAIRARSWGVTLASSLIPANSCVPGSPVPQEPADASTMSQLTQSPLLPPSVHSRRKGTNCLQNTFHYSIGWEHLKRICVNYCPKLSLWWEISVSALRRCLFIEAW